MFVRELINKIKNNHLVLGAKNLLEGYSLKKIVALVLALICLATLSLGCGSNNNDVSSEPEPDTPTPSLIVDNTIYCSTGREPYFRVDESAILGKVTSTVPYNQWPTENGQANRPILDAPFAQYEDDIAVRIEGKWIIFKRMQDTSVPYGNYIFETALYMNPFSSFLAADGYIEYYTFTGDALVITEETGSQRSIPVKYERSPVHNQNFLTSFETDVGIPDISKYDERYKYTLNEPTSTNPAYQLYLMDSEVWLARLNNGSMWSIYKISRFEGKLPIPLTEVVKEHNSVVETDSNDENVPNKNDYEATDSKVADYLEYNFQDRFMYIAGLKVFEEFGTSNEGSVSISTDENILTFSMTKSTGTVTGTLDGPTVFFRMDIGTNKITDKKFDPAPNYKELGREEFVEHSEELIQLTDERMVEIGYYFEELIMEIEAN